MDITQQDRIDRYIRGEMSQAETKTFEQEATRTHSLFKQLEFTLLVRKAIANRQQKLHTVRGWKRRKAKRLARLVTVAVVAALLVVGYVVVKPSSSSAEQKGLDNKQVARKHSVPSPQTTIAHP